MLRKSLGNIPVSKCYLSAMLLLCCLAQLADSCSPGRSGARRRSTRKLTPLVFKQHVPNIPENSLGASGPPEGRIRGDDGRFRSLVPNYNTDIVFKDEEGTGVDRLMTPRCKERLDILAISVMNMWPGVRLRVIEGFDEDGHHPMNSLHYEGRAVAISTSDRDISKYGMLARLAVDAGFDWVFYESRSHIYCSVKIESTVPSRFSACFHGTSKVVTKNGEKTLKDLAVGDEVLTSWDYHTVSFGTVIGFLHRDTHFQARFVELRTSSNNSLLLTKDHLIFSRQKAVKAENLQILDRGQKAEKMQIGDRGQKAVNAEKLQIGDRVLVSSSSGTLVQSTVVSLSVLSLSGVYAPLTDSGTIVVDGVLSSCYAVVDSHDLAHFAFLPLRMARKIRDALSVIANGSYDFGLSWLRSRTDFGRNFTESYVHWYARFLCELSGIFVTICK